MPDIFGLISIATALVAVWFAVQIRSMLMMWTARQAWTWMIVSLLAVLLHSVFSLRILQMNEAVNSATAYFSATMLLTPLVTILGARRPGIFAWHWFVVLPMIVVLQWAAFSQLQGNHWRTPIELSAPLVMGFAVVLVMSAGTFLGMNSLFALVYALGIAIFLTSGTTPASVQSPVLRSGPLLILAAIWIFHRNLRLQTAQLQTASTTIQQTKALQNLFGSLYGFAWSRRVQDRVNQFAPREQWSVRLTSAGFERPDGNLPTDEELRKPCEALLWVLARFGDETWLQHILNQSNLR